MKDKELLFKEEFNWENRFIDNDIEEKDDVEFYKGILYGVGLTVLSGLLLSLVNLL